MPPCRSKAALTDCELTIPTQTGYPTAELDICKAVDGGVRQPHQGHQAVAAGSIADTAARLAPGLRYSLHLGLEFPVGSVRRSCSQQPRPLPGPQAAAEHVEHVRDNCFLTVIGMPNKACIDCTSIDAFHT